MAEVEISYNGQNIVELNANGEKTLKTGGKFNAYDIGVKYTKPQVGITPSGSQTFTQNGTYDVSALAQAIVNVSGGGSGAVTGTFTLASRSVVNITHNANLNDYIFVAQMQSSSFEALKQSGTGVANSAVAFMVICSDNFYDFVGATTLPMCKQGVRWYYNPSTNALSISATTTTPVNSYTKDTITCRTTWGAYEGTYDWYALPLN